VVGAVVTPAGVGHREVVVMVDIATGPAPVPAAEPGGRSIERASDRELYEQVEHLLGEAARQTWTRLGTLLDDPSPCTDHAAITELVDALLGLSGDRAPAFASLLLYRAAVNRWVLNDDSDGRVTTLVNRAGAGSPAPRSDATDADVLRWASGALMRTLGHQVRTENALFCSCPFDLGRHALRAAAEANHVRSVLLGRGAHSTGEQPLTEQLLEMLHRSAADIETYWDFLGCTVAPASQMFVMALRGGASRSGAVDALKAASRQSEIVEKQLLGRDRELASGARAQRLALSDAADAFSRAEPLVVDDGSITLVFPFAFPDVDPDVLVRTLWSGASASRSGGGEDTTPNTVLPDHLGGLPFEVRAAPRTDTWRIWDNKTGVDRNNIRVQIVFPRHDVELQTTAPTRVRRLEVAIELSSLGNHSVCVTTRAGDPVDLPVDASGGVATDRELRDWSLPVGPSPRNALPPGLSWSMEQTSGGPSHATASLSGWTGHDIDQWVRRATYQVGSERILFVPHDEGAPTSFPSFIRLARNLVDWIAPVARDLVPASVPATERTTAADVVNDLHIGAQVVIQIARASRISPTGGVATPVEDPTDLRTLLGGSAVLSPQSSLPATLDEWARFTPADPRNLLGPTSSRRDLVCRTEDVILLCMLESPQWKATSTAEIAAFAASLGGFYAAWSVWLRSVTRSAEQESLTGTPDVAAPTRRPNHQRTATSELRDMSDPDLARRHEELRDRKALISDHLAEVRWTLPHLRSTQIIRTGEQRRLLDALLTDGAIGREESALELQIAALAAEGDRIGQLIDAVDAERTRRSEHRRNLLLASLTAFGLVSLFGWFHQTVREQFADMEIRVETLVTIVLLGVGLEMLRRLVVAGHVGLRWRGHGGRDGTSARSDADEVVPQRSAPEGPRR
jgi:hypothetical protein